jgi:hypothetical protein
VLEGVAIGVVLLVVVAVLTVWLIRREDTRLRRKSQRYRELKLEGIEELRRGDPYPEEPPVHGGGWMREPDGRRANADRVLHDELERAREHTRRLRRARSRTRSIRRGKGAEWLLA